MDIYKFILQLICKVKSTQNSQNNIKEDRVGRLILPAFKTYCKTNGNQDNGTLVKEETIDQGNIRRAQKQTHTHTVN